MTLTYIVSTALMNIESHIKKKIKKKKKIVSIPKSTPNRLSICNFKLE
jgi:hypothetical protein